MSLIRHADFRRLWAGDTISQLGQQVGVTVLPLLAVTALAATPFEMGLLTAAEQAAFLVLGLPAGVWVDRLRRRPVMLAADFARAALLLSVPVAWWLGVLTLTQLIVVALLAGAGTLFFDVAYQSYLPSLISREHLLEGNSKLQASMSVAQVAGPGLGGVLIQLVSAANAVLATGLGFLGSALCLLRIRTAEPAPAPHEKAKLRVQITEGLRFVFRERNLRAITISTATGSVGNGIFLAVMMIFFSRTLGLPAAGIGLVLAIGSAFGVLGAVTAGFVNRRVGRVRAIWLVPLCTWPCGMLAALAMPGWRIAFAAAGYGIFSYGLVVFNVANVSYRQAVCPDRLLGRMTASIRFVVWGMYPIGGLIGGALGEVVGIRETVIVGTALSGASVLWMVFSPLRKLRDMPEPATR
ncbi:Na+/melibiose symporter [Amycolatopsis xylanica]|uniref:Na+/melibiose symporter n=1 Tax=Amycolatopsis xylanica TaxID=589385 RepID=A0A1H3Q488_9PSEU|nr:MFS transporter [Amycolatopsis xylanica]SDZ07928.1 Na+/melibiose symporter [Amycolatopsis xylanica]